MAECSACGAPEVSFKVKNPDGTESEYAVCKTCREQAIKIITHPSKKDKTGGISTAQLMARLRFPFRSRFASPNPAPTDQNAVTVVSNPEVSGSKAKFHHHRQISPTCFQEDKLYNVPLEHTRYPRSGKYSVPGARAIVGKLKPRCLEKFGRRGLRVKYRKWATQSILTPKNLHLKPTATERKLERNPEGKPINLYFARVRKYPAEKNFSDEDERHAWEAGQAKRGELKSRTCPTCHRPGVLSAFEAQRGYQCRSCTARDEGYGMNPEANPKIKREHGNHIEFDNGDAVFFDDRTGQWWAYDRKTKYTRRLVLNGKTINDVGSRADALTAYKSDYEDRYELKFKGPSEEENPSKTYEISDDDEAKCPECGGEMTTVYPRAYGGRVSYQECKECGHQVEENPAGSLKPKIKEIQFKVPIDKADHLVSRLKEKMWQDDISTDAYYDDPEHYMTVILRTTPQRFGYAKSLLKNYGATVSYEENPGHAPRKTIDVQKYLAMENPGPSMSITEAGKLYHLYHDWSFTDRAEAEKTMNEFIEGGLAKAGLVRKYKDEYNVYLFEMRENPEKAKPDHSICPLCKQQIPDEYYGEHIANYHGHGSVLLTGENPSVDMICQACGARNPHDSMCCMSDDGEGPHRLVPIQPRTSIPMAPSGATPFTEPEDNPKKKPQAFYYYADTMAVREIHRYKTEVVPGKLPTINNLAYGMWCKHGEPQGIVKRNLPSILARLEKLDIVRSAEDGRYDLIIPVEDAIAKLKTFHDYDKWYEPLPENFEYYASTSGGSPQTEGNPRTRAAMLRVGEYVWENYSETERFAWLLDHGFSDASAKTIAPRDWDKLGEETRLRISDKIEQEKASANPPTEGNPKRSILELTKEHELAARKAWKHADICNECFHPIIDEEGNPGYLAEACGTGKGLLENLIKADNALRTHTEENPKKKRAKLTPEEDKAWTQKFIFYIDEGKTELQADKQAWKEMVEEFPRLKNFDGAMPNPGLDWDDFEDNPGVRKARQEAIKARESGHRARVMQVGEDEYGAFIDGPRKQMIKFKAKRKYVKKPETKAETKAEAIKDIKETAEKLVDKDILTKTEAKEAVKEIREIIEKPKEPEKEKKPERRTVTANELEVLHGLLHSRDLYGNLEATRLATKYIEKDRMTGVEAFKKMMEELKLDKPKMKVSPTIPHQTGLKTRLARFLPKEQMHVIGGLLRGEEGEYFQELLGNLATTFEEMPATYETEKVPAEKKMVRLHYFSSASDWYIIEKDKEPDQKQAFGFVCLNGDMQNAEMGYINIEELQKSKRVELDFYWKPKTLNDVKDELEKKWGLQGRLTEEAPPAAPPSAPEAPLAPSTPPPPPPHSAPLAAPAGKEPSPEELATAMAAALQKIKAKATVNPSTYPEQEIVEGR